MLITNKFNLPQAYVDAVKETHPIVDKHYSVTGLLNPIRELLLKRRHYDDIEQDVSDMVWLIFGSAVHKIVEDADKTGYAEYKLQWPIIEDYVLTGICDLYNEELFAVEDHKTASVIKIIKGEFNDWKMQGLMYAYMLRKLGHHVAKLRFHALMKDWSAREYRNRGSKFYPEHPIWTWEYDIQETDMKYIEEWILQKFKDIIAAEKLSDNDLPLCTPDERWNTGDKYAVYKHAGDKRAIAVVNTEAEAHQAIREKCGGAGEIEFRKGEDKKCRDYCLVNKFCNYWRKMNERIN